MVKVYFILSMTLATGFAIAFFFAMMHPNKVTTIWINTAYEGIIEFLVIGAWIILLPSYIRAQKRIFERAER